jgi:hypothetical protein
MLIEVGFAAGLPASPGAKTAARESFTEPQIAR